MVAAVVEEYSTAPISEAERALFAFIAKVVEDSTSIGDADVARARAAGWSDSAIYDAITVCALFQFYTTWIDASGVQDMPALGDELAGRRLATDGYARAEPPVPR